MSWPAEPDVPPEQRATATGHFRYEDVSQDGRLKLDALPHAYGLVVWQKLLMDHPWTRAAGRQGVIPILTRLALEGGEGPVTVRKPYEADGSYQLAHTVDENGRVNRIILNMWTRLRAPRGRMYGPPPSGAGEMIEVGRCYVEHVFTRLFAPPEQRKVLKFEIPGAPEVPDARHTWRPPTELLELPPGAEPLDAALTADPAPAAFGLTHCDSNQHVNSLVYPRLFEDAVLRRLARHGVSTALLGRAVEVAYRKPCFAGEEVPILLRAFRTADGQVGASGVYGDAERPRCALRIVFAP